MPFRTRMTSRGSIYYMSIGTWSMISRPEHISSLEILVWLFVSIYLWLFQSTNTDIPQKLLHTISKKSKNVDLWSGQNLLCKCLRFHLPFIVCLNPYLKKAVLFLKLYVVASNSNLLCAFSSKVLFLNLFSRKLFLKYCGVYSNL